MVVEVDIQNNEVVVRANGIFSRTTESKCMTSMDFKGESSVSLYTCGFQVLHACTGFCCLTMLNLILWN